MYLADSAYNFVSWKYYIKSSIIMLTICNVNLLFIDLALIFAPHSCSICVCCYKNSQNSPRNMHKCYFKIHVSAKLFSRFRSKAASTHCSVCPSIWELACWRFSLLGELKKSIENKIIFFTKRLKDFVERFFLIFFSFFYLDEMGWQWGEGWDFISPPQLILATRWSASRRRISPYIKASDLNI